MREFVRGPVDLDNTTLTLSSWLLQIHAAVARWRPRTGPNLAIIGEGGKVENPSQFSKIVGDLMAIALD